MQLDKNPIDDGWFTGGLHDNWDFKQLTAQYSDNQTKVTFRHDKGNRISIQFDKFVRRACESHKQLLEALKRAERDIAKLQYPDPIPPDNLRLSETRSIALAAITKAEAV